MPPSFQPLRREIDKRDTPERLSRYFADGWTILLTLRTSEFTEHAHVGQLHDHTHRMGLLIATRERAQTPGEYEL